MDLSELLDGTEPVEAELLGKKITCDVYTSGWERLNKEQRESIQPVAIKIGEQRQRIEEIEAELKNDVPEDRRPALEAELQQIRQSGDLILYARAFVPLMVKGLSTDDGPLTFRGKSFPEFVPDLPDMLLMEITNKASDAIGNPTNGEASQSTSQDEAKPEELSQTASTQG